MSEELNAQILILSNNGKTNGPVFQLQLQTKHTLLSVNNFERKQQNIYISCI